MINVTALQLEIALGRFHRVTSITANQKYLEVQNSDDVLYLLPVYPARKTIIEIPYCDPAPPPAQSVLHLDHLELHDVTHVLIAAQTLSIRTAQGVSFQWKVHRHVPLPLHP